MDHLGSLARLDRKAHLGHLATKANKETKDRLDLKAVLEHLVHRAHVVCLDPMDHRVHLERADLW